MAVWITPSQRSIGSMVVSPKTTLNLMQNCDLPPPVKLFSGPDDTFISLISKSYNNIGKGQNEEEEEEEEEETKKGDHLLTSRDSQENYDKLELLKALSLSQTRAREAERKLVILNKERDELSKMVVEDSLRLFAHRHWIKLLELEVIKLQRQATKKKRRRSENGVGKRSRREDCDDDDHSSKSWCVAVVCCLAIAGMGFAIFSDHFSLDSSRFCLPFRSSFFR